MSSVKTAITDVQKLYKQMNSASDEFERARVISDSVSEQPILDLAQKVMAEVDRLMPNVKAEEEQLKLLSWREDAETLHCYYGPMPEPKYSPETLERMRKALLYSMGVL